jgi:dTDP-4-dehydrorhamnose reductase
MAVNGTGPGNVGQAARAVGAQALHISTDYVFDGTAQAPRVEHHPVGPTCQYGHSKLAGERAFLAAVSEGAVPHWVVRTSWVFGPGGANFVSTMLRLMAERPSVRVVADQHGRPTYSQDLARAILSLMGLDGAPSACPSGVYHFANGGTTTWHGLCVEVLSAAQRLGHPLRCQQVEPVSTEAFPRPAQRPAYSILSTEKFERAAHWTPRPFGEAVAHYLSSVPGAC